MEGEGMGWESLDWAVEEARVLAMAVESTVVWMVRVPGTRTQGASGRGWWEEKGCSSRRLVCGVARTLRERERKGRRELACAVMTCCHACSKAASASVRGRCREWSHVRSRVHWLHA